MSCNSPAATVLRGPLSYGPESRRRKIILRLSEDRPIVIEIVESEAKIKELLPLIEPMLGDASALVTLERVTVLRYGFEGSLVNAAAALG